VLTAVQRGQQARRDSWPAVLTIGVKSGQLWQFGGPAAAQAYIPTSDDKNATDWVIVGGGVVDVEAVKLAPTAPQVAPGASLGKDPDPDVYDSRGVVKEGGKSAPVGGRGPTAPRDAKPAPTDSARRAAQPVNTVTDYVDNAGNEKGSAQIGIRGTHTSRDTYKAERSVLPVVRDAGVVAAGYPGTREALREDDAARQGVGPLLPSVAVDPAQQALVDEKHAENADLAARIADGNQVGNEHVPRDINTVGVLDRPNGGATASGFAPSGFVPSGDPRRSDRATAVKSDTKWSGETKPANSK